MEIPHPETALAHNFDISGNNKVADFYELKTSTPNFNNR
jgi:hypothetical protein